MKSKREKPIKKTSKKNAKKTSVHKDSKSHNVNIRVISGKKEISNVQKLINDRNELEKEFKENLFKINNCEQQAKANGMPTIKKHFVFWAKRYKKRNSHIKSELKLINAMIMKAI